MAVSVKSGDGQPGQFGKYWFAIADNQIVRDMGESASTA